MAKAINVMDKKWQAEEDARTLRRAEEIKCDAKRMEAAKKVATEEISAMKSVMKMKPVKRK